MSEEKKVSSKTREKITNKVGEKKGRKSWKPAKLLTVKGKTEGYRYRWCNKDPDNLRKKEEEGWVFVNSTNDPNVEHDRPDNIEDGGPLTSGMKEYREMVLMAMDEETAKARDEYMKEETAKRSQANLKDSLKEDVATVGNSTKAKLHGGITFD